MNVKRIHYLIYNSSAFPTKQKNKNPNRFDRLLILCFGSELFVPLLYCIQNNEAACTQKREFSVTIVNTHHHC